MIRAAYLAALLAALSPASPLHLRVSPIQAFGPHAITVSVAVVPLATDREEWILLCDLADDEPCTRRHAERLSERTVNGADDSPLWTPPPWREVSAGTYAIVAAIGPTAAVRASAVAKVRLLAP